ncbi:MAG: hypothetical protein QOC69_680, partial [Mycobacterium sp.]|nr:hypothetical protein [Mycobacterium sp.]
RLFVESAVSLLVDGMFNADGRAGKRHGDELFARRSLDQSVELPPDSSRHGHRYYCTAQHGCREQHEPTDTATLTCCTLGVVS